MSDTSDRLALPYLQPAQAQKHVTHNAALARLDAIVQLAVAGIGTVTPPAAPLPGEAHVVGVGAGGDWAGQDGSVAAWDGAGWDFIPPRTGWRAWDAAAQELRIWTGTAWVLPKASLADPAMLGINTGADATNRLAVAAEATLLTHAGAGHQVKVNKAAPADTASLLFQSNWSGRAEMGLAGDDSFAVKVSADGTAWSTALRIDGATGAVGIGPLAGTDATLSVAADGLSPTIQVRNVGGIGGAGFRMIDDSSGGDWKVKTTNNGSFKIRDETGGIDHVLFNGVTRCSEFAGAVQPAGFSVAALPDPAALGAGAMIFVTDETGGPVPAFSDGTDWRRTTDRAVVS
ncbi:DUF2793 domain-containing protein [Roseisalinus antarcticus]|uniref:DUF2793 domain-containing protein n=1 Tax=Roseisalinus antarcticus TaxID=254357 RepID=A0A1Y5TPH5_9RHOB|nr:DUF2793 domain-containing protein [Roseisalinus antarcticus]SLN68860.1 hypothetical protein ROA7023_03335 [Roseisalinus antarcticus]